MRAAAARARAIMPVLRNATASMSTTAAAASSNSNLSAAAAATTAAISERPRYIGTKKKEIKPNEEILRPGNRSQVQK